MDNGAQTPGGYVAPQDIEMSGNVATAGSGHGGMPAVTAGSSLSEGHTMATPTGGNATATPHRAQNSATPGTVFNQEGVGSGFVTNRFPQTGTDPFVSPSHNLRANPNRFQVPSGANQIQVPDAGDLILNRVYTPPSLRVAEQSNSGAQGAHGSGNNRQQSVPHTTPNQNRQMESFPGMYQSAECLVRTLEVSCEQTRIVLRILWEHSNNAPNVYNQCLRMPNVEERKYYWERYIGELRTQYDSIRDCLWCCVRYLVSRLSVWCKAYQGILPDAIFHRGVLALNVAKVLKTEIDNYRFPELSMVRMLAQAAAEANQGNGNGNAYNASHQRQ